MSRTGCPQPGETLRPKIATGQLRWTGCPQPLFGIKSHPANPSLWPSLEFVTHSCKGQDTQALLLIP